MAQDRFWDRPRTTFTTSQGAVELPALYRDASAVAAFFRIEHARAAEVLASTPFTPVRFATGFALAGLAVFDYRDSTIGPYRECAVTVAAMPSAHHALTSPVLDLLRPATGREVGLHIVDLPVTTALADAAGRELWGLPKFVTTIDFDLGDPLRCAVNAPGGGEPIVVLEGSAGTGVAVPSIDLVLYSVLRGETLRTLVNTRGKMRTSLGGGLKVRVGSSTPMSSRLMALGLDGARPWLVQVGERVELVLHAGQRVADARAA